MRKKLLITSIVMMLVIAVALSTATYAWFTSAQSVTAEDIVMTAGTSGSTALGIAWTAGTAGTSFNTNYSTSIVAKTPSTSQTNGFQPAAPVALSVSVKTAPVFQTAFIDAQGKFTEAGSNTDVYRFTEDEEVSPSTLIHVSNLAQRGDVTLYLTARITTNTSESDGTDLIRIAVYEYDETNSEYNYKGLLGKTAAVNNTAVGTVAANVTAASLLTMSAATELNLGTLNAQTDKAYAIFVWLDGALFDERYSGRDAKVGLTFSTTSVSQ